MTRLLRTLNWIASRGHRWLGFVAGAIVIVMAMTGMLLVFKDPVVHALNPRLAHISQAFASGTQPLPLPQLLHPGLYPAEQPIARVIIDPSGERPSSLRFSASPRNAVYFDPYTGQPLKAIKGLALFSQIQEIHQHLAAGRGGKAVIDATACSVVVLCLSGSFLFLVRTAGRWRSVFRLSGRSWQQTLKQLHGLLGIWGVALFLTIALTGLYWSYGWYHRAAHSLLAGPHRAALDHPAARQATVSRATLTSWQKALDQFPHCTRRFIDLRVISSDAFWANLRCLPETPAAPPGFSGVIRVHQDHIIAQYPLAREPVGQRLLVQIAALHTGQLFGTAGRILWFIAALALAVIAATGLLTFRAHWSSSKRHRERTAASAPTRHG